VVRVELPMRRVVPAPCSLVFIWRDPGWIWERSRVLRRWSIPESLVFI
jgi:hypothetical protein